MKRIISPFAVLLSFFLAVNLFSCKEDESPKKEDTTPTNTSTTYAIQQNDSAFVDLEAIDFADDLFGVAVGRKSWVDADGFSRSEGRYYLTEDGGNTWTMSSSAIDFINAGNSVVVIDKNNMWACGTYGKITYSTNGVDWIKQIEGGTGPTIRAINDLYFFDANNGWAAAGSQNSGSPVTYTAQMLNTTDGGKTWTLKHNDPDYIPFSGLAFLDQTNGMAIASGYKDNRIVTTTDQGQTWNEVFQSSKTDLRLTDAIAVNGAFIVCGNDNNAGIILTSLDTGKTWTQTENISNFYPRNIDFYDNMNGFMVGRIDGPTVVRTTDGGATWVVDEELDRYYDEVNDDYFNSFWGVCAQSPSAIYVCGERGSIAKRK